MQINQLGRFQNQDIMNKIKQMVFKVKRQVVIVNQEQIILQVHMDTMVSKQDIHMEMVTQAHQI